MTDPDESRDPLDLLAEEFLSRVREGQSVTPESFAAEHEEHAAALLDLLPTLLVLEQARRDRESSSTGPRRVEIPELERLGDYQIVREIGRGGMGVVFEAVQESLGRLVALKVLPQSRMFTGHQLERFQREAQIAARLQELSSHLRAELLAAGKPHDCCWGSDLHVFYGPSNDRANRIHPHRSLWGRDGSG